MFTIIICTYNGEKRLTRGLTAICSCNKIDQLVSSVIVVDNASTDGTKNVINSFIKKSTYKNIKYIYEEKPGLSNARLTGILNCNTQWVIFLDDDNIITYDWVEKAYEYIRLKEGLGAFNGQVIPSFDEPLSSELKMVLKASYSGLACTCTGINEMININENQWKPFGAGLVVLRQPLLNLAKQGWLKCKGRKGQSLSSGEDTEIVEWIKKQGLNWGFCNDMMLFHEISLRRLDIEYLKKLYESFGMSNYISISKKHFYILRRMKWLFIELYSFVRATVKITFIYNKKMKDEDYYKCILAKARFNGYKKCLIHDHVFWRG